MAQPPDPLVLPPGVLSLSGESRGGDLAATPDPASLSLRCPACREDLWIWRDGWVLRNAIVKLGGASGRDVLIRCPTRGCGRDVPVPFLALVSPPPEPAQRATPRRRLVVSARNRTETP